MDLNSKFKKKNNNNLKAQQHRLLAKHTLDSKMDHERRPR